MKSTDALQFSIKDKILLTFGMSAFFFTVILYVNLNGTDREWSAIFGRLFPSLLLQFLLGVLMIFGFLLLAGWIHRQFEHWFGEEIISKGGILPNLLALVIFSLANLAVIRYGIMLIFWLQTLVFGDPGTSDFGHSEYDKMSLRFNYAANVIMSLFVYYLLTNRRIVQRMGEVSLRTEKAKKENIASQYSLLRSKVNPHFFFNSLSTLSSLVQVDPEKSEEFIDRLSKSYRYMLENNNQQTVPLQVELDFLKAYSFLLKTRFGDKIQIAIKLPDPLPDGAELVPLSFQVLIDRVLKNNQMSIKSPIVIEVLLMNGELLVRNNHQPRQVPDHTISDCDWGVFENCYLLFFNQQIQEVFDGTHWTVHLPLLRKTSGTEKTGLHE
jgi:two-component system, LytTR family, sensor kinase